MKKGQTEMKIQKNFILNFNIQLPEFTIIFSQIWLLYQLMNLIILISLFCKANSSGVTLPMFFEFKSAPL